MDRPTEATLPVHVIHNHFASVRVPERILGSAGDEWVTDQVETAAKEIILQKFGR